MNSLFQKISKKLTIVPVLLLLAASVFANNGIRHEVLLNDGWKTVMNETNADAYKGFEQTVFNDAKWKSVNVPHNWDQHGGYRRLKHGNLHGYAWYRKSFVIGNKEEGKRYFLYFEGVSSYATVYMNGKKIGYHAGGRTTFTLDATDALAFGKSNILAVKADHPAMISDLPWVCGGCSSEWGFSEGTQPMGIYRPVHLVVTDEVRVNPFGVHVWNDSTVTGKSALLFLETEIKNHGAATHQIQLVQRFIDGKGKTVAQLQTTENITAGATKTIKQQFTEIQHPTLWSIENPYLYTLVTEIKENNHVIDKVETPYGIRWVKWDIKGKNPSNRFYLNGKPVFINGTAEYEHLMGRSHAFTDEEVVARVNQVKAAGYNSFRDAHQPHNLLYQKYWDESGILFWPQLSAHIWYDTPQFRNNFKQLLTEWVKERRNSPSVILWGLQNESTLPESFARECTELIRTLDPTSSSQRLVTTCNGGTGTDWNVIQNWSGTYSGNPAKYGEELSYQLLNGEYGAWRSIDLHSEGEFNQSGALSEDRMTLLMESKIRLAEAVKDKVCGQYHWLLNSHENPGRIQNEEGTRDIDRVGPVNYKGVFTPWGEPLDAFYMFRANYISKEKEPMVYIASHTWPDRWMTPGVKDGIIVYSNCNEVELFNDVDGASLGRLKNQGRGTHFTFNNIDVKYNVLKAVGYVNGKAVATDVIVLNHLPKAPLFSQKEKEKQAITAPEKGFNYLFRVNCGGGDYTDANGKLWMADRAKTDSLSWGSVSWSKDYPGMHPYYASQRRTRDAIAGTNDDALFQTFRYGMDKLHFDFPVPDGEYRVELYFTEPWYGIGNVNAKGWRVFDVAVNNRIVLKDFDIWKEAGVNRAVKKAFNVNVKGGQLSINFPDVKAGEAVISAITIASKDNTLKAAPASSLFIADLAVTADSTEFQVKTWTDTGDKAFSNSDASFSSLPAALYTAERIVRPTDTKAAVSFRLTNDATVYIALSDKISLFPPWLTGFEITNQKVELSNGKKYNLFKARFKAGDKVKTHSNATADYIVFVTPDVKMDEAKEARSVTTYEAEKAKILGPGLVKGNFKSKGYVEFTRPEKDTLEFNFSVGLASTYLLRFQYMNMNTTPAPLDFEIISPNGTVMRKDRLEFPVASEKWKSFNTTTGTTINAGTYKLRLLNPGLKGVRIVALEVE
ncbi:malectin domain-containing carbohydrate-binding protein [Parabacteroides sp. FAFU027]|uniref:malectin domain-containing carbohydrate-binding protein n=1 Tax=Parabacteroides sp. FAFU027 TaxID=2922715 RepID=UPI001FAF742C|nr:malectin domain-containing carbohydrate-binding protein [Parabacteroides sp. FAFU027]